MAVPFGPVYLSAQKTVQAMRKMRIYVAPSANKKQGYPNKYFIQLKEALADYFEVLESDNRRCFMQGGALLRNSFKADVFLLSFVETIAFHKLAFFQYLLSRLSLWIMKIRGRKIVFILHNPKPHKGENFMSRSLTRIQFKLSEAVIAHSKEAGQMARTIVSSLGGDPDKVHYISHPVTTYSSCQSIDSSRREYVLIWGNILPYKGVLEFVQSKAVRDSGLEVRIVGKCNDSVLSSSIRKAVSVPSKTVFYFENRAADFNELSSLIAGSRCVLFPYRPGSVSSSGVLIDTIAMGGNPVGPAIGAFLDLSEDGLCMVYRTEEEMLGLLQDGNSIDDSVREEFIKENSWSSFARKVFGLILAE